MRLFSKSLIIRQFKISMKEPSSLMKMTQTKTNMDKQRFSLVGVDFCQLTIATNPKLILASRITNHATSLSSQERQWMEYSISVWLKLMTANFLSPPSLTPNRKINWRDNQLSKWAQLHQICLLWNTPIILKAKNFSLLKIFKRSDLIRNHKIWI